MYNRCIERLSLGIPFSVEASEIRGRMEIYVWGTKIWELTGSTIQDKYHGNNVIVESPKGFYLFSSSV